MHLSTSELKKWGIVSWQTGIWHATPSKGGAVGVMFCWVTQPLYEGVDYDDPRTAHFVIKPSAGSAAPTKLAEDLMGRTLGAASLNTLPIPRTDSRFQAVLASLRRHHEEVRDFFRQRPNHSSRSTQEMQALLDRWNQVWPHYEKAHTLMVQDLAQGIKEFSDVYRDYSHMGLQRALFDDRLMINFGKLFVVDAVLGNGDRLSAMNTGNIAYCEVTRRIWAIDSQALLTDYQNSLNKGCHSAANWIEVLVQGGVAAAEQEGAVQAPTFAMADLYDVDSWWRRCFRPHFEDTLKRDQQKLPSEELWALALSNFKRGVDEGLAAVDRQLSGLNWMAVKSNFKSLEKRYGSSANLDWTNFKIRRMYVRMALAEKNKPGTPKEKKQRAMDKVVAYAERKVGGRHF
jgi:hypothetical protein